MDNLLEQLEQWNKNDEFSRCIEAIEAIPEKERGYKLTVLLGRAYSRQYWEITRRMEMMMK